MRCYARAKMRRKRDTPKKRLNWGIPIIIVNRLIDIVDVDEFLMEVSHNIVNLFFWVNANLFLVNNNIVNQTFYFPILQPRTDGSYILKWDNISLAQQQRERT